jgi:hypothetical protein
MDHWVHETMSPITLEVSDELAERLRPLVHDLPRILELGLRQFQAEAQPGCDGAAEVFEFLARLPGPEETLTLRPSEALQSRVSELLAKTHIVGLTPAEAQEWQHYQYLEHLVRMAKARARMKLESP